MKQEEHLVNLEHDRLKQQERIDHMHENKWAYYIKQREACRLENMNAEE